MLLPAVYFFESFNENVRIFFFRYSIYLYLGLEPGRIDQMLVNNHTSLEVFQYASEFMRHDALPDSYRQPHFYDGPKATQRVHPHVLEEFADLQAHLLNPDFRCEFLSKFC